MPGRHGRRSAISAWTTAGSVLLRLCGVSQAPLKLASALLPGERNSKVRQGIDVFGLSARYTVCGCADLAPITKARFWRLREVPQRH